MSVVLISPVLIVPLCIVLWKHDLDGQAKSLVHGLLVLFGALVSAGAYIELTGRLDREPDIVGKIWLALPLFAAMVVTGRCVFGRLARLILKSRRHSSCQACE